MNDYIKIQNLSFKYYNNTVLKNIDFNVIKGSFISILGPNGSGKTTLLKNLCRLLKPLSGNIVLEKDDIKGLKYKEFAKKIAVVHQGTDMSFEFSVYDVVLMGRYPYQRIFRNESDIDFNIVKNAMTETGVWDLREKSINEISGGERQRVMIARSLAQEPEILLLDEPISHLDIKHQINILNLCKKLNDEKKITVISTLHDINLASRYSDYILLINNGTIEKFDTPEKVLTEENIEKVYNIKVKFFKDYEENKLYIIPKAI